MEVADSAEGDPMITTIEGNILTDPVPQKQPTSAQRVFPFPRGGKPQRNQWATGLNYESVAMEPPGYYPILCNPKKGGIAMKTKTMGAMIAQRRKGMGMTQLELANKMGGDGQSRFKMGEKFVLPGYPFLSPFGRNPSCFR